MEMSYLCIVNLRPQSHFHLQTRRADTCTIPGTARADSRGSKINFQFSIFNFQFSIKKMDKKRIFDILAKMIVAALTAALTAVTTTSCMGHGPF